MINKCPLCQSSNIVHVESLPTNRINQLYFKSFNITKTLKSNYLEYFQCGTCSLGFFNPMEAGNENFYESLQQKDWYYMDDKEEFKIASSWLEGSNLLEVGSGKAAFAKYIGKENYTGLEFNESAITKAANDGITLLKESIEDHAASGKRYDAVVSFQVLEHVPDPRSFIQSCIDCLKPTGKLVIAVPSKDGIVGLASNNILNMPPHHVTHWSTKTFEEIGNIFNVNCITIQHEPIAEYHRNFASSIITQSWLKNKLGIKSRLLETRFHVRMIERVGSKLSLLLRPNLNGVKGHTVIAIYEK